MNTLKKLAISLLTISMLTSLTGCEEEIGPAPADSYHAQLTGGAFAVNLSLENNNPKAIESTSEKLTRDLRNYIIQNVDTDTYNYMVQLEEDSVRWIDFKGENTKLYKLPFNDGFTHLQNAVVSTKGDYLVVNLTEESGSAWSRVLVINTNDDTYSQPLDDNTLLVPSEESSCESVTLVDRRSKEDQFNECIAERPSSVYILDYFANSYTVVIIKQFPSGNLIYTIDLR